MHEVLEAVLGHGGHDDGEEHLPLTKWFAAIWLVANDKRGMSAAELQGYVGCSYRSARYLFDRIRCAMARSEWVLPS